MARPVRKSAVVALPRPRLVPKPKRIRPADGVLFRLKIGSAYQPREADFIHIDGISTENVDHVVDLKAPPWPIEDSVVDFIFSGFYYHRLTREQRYTFMEECYRILKPGAQITLVMPHWSSMRAITDPHAEWPPLCESSFMIYSKQYRDQDKSDLPLICDFGGSYGYGTTVDQDIGTRNDEFQQQARKHWLNANLDLNITLTKASV